jgi:hypothetical protein
MLVTQPRRRTAVLLVALIMAAACVPRTNTGTPQRPAPNDDSPVRRGTGGLDPVAAYANAGLIAEADPIQFVGGVKYFAGATADSTLMMVTLSMPNRDFTFAPELDGYRGRYQVSIELRRGAEIAPGRRTGIGASGELPRIHPGRREPHFSAVRARGARAVRAGDLCPRRGERPERTS